MDTGDSGRATPLARRTLAKVERRLLPLLFLMYGAVLLVRANVGLAALQMREDLGFSATVFGLGGGIFILGYSSFAVPSNLILARTGARRWIAPILILSGGIGAAMTLVEGPLSFYGLRFLLGVAEAGFFPGIIYYLSRWMPAAQRARPVALFMAAIPATGVVSGLLASVLFKLEGQLGLAGWEWLFLVEGVPAVLLGGVAFYALTDDPAHARWLTGEERAWLIEQLQGERASVARPRAWRLRDALADRTLWRLSLLTFLMLTGGHAYGLWAPQLIQGMMDLSDSQVSLVTSGIAAASVLAMLINAAHSDRWQERRLHVAIPAFITALGWLLCLRIHSGAAGVIALGLIAVGGNSLYGPFWAWPHDSPAAAASAGRIALIVAIGSVGGFIGPNLVGLTKDLTGSYDVAFLVLGVMALGAALLAVAVRPLQRG